MCNNMEFPSTAILMKIIKIVEHELRVCSSENKEMIEKNNLKEIGHYIEGKMNILNKIVGVLNNEPI